MSADVQDEGGTNVPLFLAYKNLKPFVEKHLGAVQFEPKKYTTPEGSVALGIYGVSPDMAIRFSIALGTTPEYWMNLQTAWELHETKTRFKDEYNKIRPIV